MLELWPITLAEGKRFVAEHHRHNDPPLGWKFGVGLARDGELVGVALAGRPVAPKLQNADPRWLEVSRVCTLGDKNANSRLYGAIARAAKALGYVTLWTYTLPEESGASLRAAGWVVDDQPTFRAGWSSPTRLRQDETLFGPRKRPSGPKVRWRKDLAERAAVPAS